MTLEEKHTEDTKPAKGSGFFQALADFLTRSPELKEAISNAEEEPAEDIETLKKEIEDLKAAIAAAEQTNAELKAELDALKLRDTEQKFSVILHALPDGMKATQEQIAEIRNSYNAGTIEDILVKALQHSATTGVTKTDGVPFVHSEPQTIEVVGDLSAVGD